MTYAKDFKITQLPNRLKYASLETLASKGIYEVIRPEIPEGKTLGQMILVEGDINHYTYELIDTPEPIPIFDENKIRLAILSTWGVRRVRSLGADYSLITENLTSHNFPVLKMLIDDMIHEQTVTQKEYDFFCNLFLQQDIDFNNY